MSFIRDLVSKSTYAITVVAALSASGCAVDASPSEPETGKAQEAIANGWTPWTSEEFSPIVCDSGSVIDMAACRGSYCDDMAVHCVKAPVGTPGAVRYTPYTLVSDLGGYEGCDDGEFVTGITCKDSYCGRISMQCTKYTNTKSANCRWGGFFSEEGPNNVSNFGIGYYARGFACYGNHCDNVNPYVCQMVANPRIIVVNPPPVDVSSY
jgi:hypothetical protein